jgi:hypothetical protein
MVQRVVCLVSLLNKKLPIYRQDYIYNDQPLKHKSTPGVQAPQETRNPLHSITWVFGGCPFVFIFSWTKVASGPWGPPKVLKFNLQDCNPGELHTGEKGTFTNLKIPPILERSLQNLQVSLPLSVLRATTHTTSACENLCTPLCGEQNMRSLWEPDISTAMSNNLQAELARPQPQNRVRAKYSMAAFPKMFTFRE